MVLPKNPKPAETGFPSISWEEEALDTRPMPMHEKPLQARVDFEMAIVAERHLRIAVSIDKFWGHKDCLHYIQSLVLSGYKEGETRMGFKPEVVVALLSLAELHRQMFGQ